MLVPRLNHSPDRFVFPCGRLASRHSKRVAQRVVTTHGHYTLSLHVGYRQTKPHIGWMLLENFYLNYRCSNFLAPGVLFGANGQPGSRAIGNILMLLMKWPTAQGGNALSFPHLGITKVGKDLPHPRGAALKRVGHQSFAVPLFSRK
jgi:hypothetical protein